MMLIMNTMPDKILNLYRLAQNQSYGGNMHKNVKQDILMDNKGDLVNIAFDYFDMILKVEHKYDQGLSMLYWNSFLELLIYVITAILTINIHRFALIILYLPHLARGILGFIIYRNLPDVDDFVLETRTNV